MEHFWDDKFEEKFDQISVGQFSCFQPVLDHRILAACRNRCGQCLQASMRFSGGVPLFCPRFKQKQRRKCSTQTEMH